MQASFAYARTRSARCALALYKFQLSLRKPLAELTQTLVFAQEFYGFVTSRSISEGSLPPPQSVTVFISLLCTSLALFTYLSKGKATAALAVASFAVLSLQLLTSEKIGLSELAVTVLGLFYCGNALSPLLTAFELLVIKHAAFSDSLCAAKHVPSNVFARQLLRVFKTGSLPSLEARMGVIAGLYGLTYATKDVNRESLMPSSNQISCSCQASSNLVLQATYPLTGSSCVCWPSLRRRQ